MTSEPCPICAEFRYISLVNVCPICNAPGKLKDVDDIADDFLRTLELKPWPWPEACPNSEGWLENGIPQEVIDKHFERYGVLLGS
jgi:hypothetical protein